MKTSPHTIVVGGTRGIGLAVVSHLVAEGHRLSVLARNLLQADGVTQYWAVDLLNKESISLASAQIVADRGPLDNLIFLQRFRGKGDTWQGELATSLEGTRRVIEEFLPHFAKDVGGAIVVVGSVAGRLIASEQGLGYHIAKAGLEQLVRYYAVSLGSRGIRVNGVCPGTIVKAESRDFYESNATLLELYRRIIPLGRMGKADEVASVVSFLCDAKASYVTGQNLIVDGGLSLQYQESLCRKLMESEIHGC